MKRLVTVAAILMTATCAHAEGTVNSGPTSQNNSNIVVPPSTNNNTNNNNVTIVVPRSEQSPPAWQGPVPAEPPPVAEQPPLRVPPSACRTGVVRGLYGNVPPGAGVNLAVRTGPGTDFPAIATITEGWFVEVCAREGNWFQIRNCRGPWSPLANGRCDGGWASRRFIAPAG